MKSTSIIISLLWFAFLPAYYLLSQTYQFKTYSLSEGLPQSQVWCGLSDQRGFLWFGTQGGGLCRFDGKTFETFTTADGLNSNFILQLHQGTNNQIWIGTNQGLCRYDGRRFTSIGGINDAVTAIFSQPNGKILAGTAHGIFQLPNDSLSALPWPQHPVLDKLHIHSIAQKDGQIWVGTSNGLWQLTPTPQKVLPDYPIHDLVIESDTLWIAVYGRGIYRYTDTLQLTKIGAPILRPMSLFKIQDGSLFIGTQDNGLIRYHPSSNTLERIDKQEAQQLNDIRDLLIDQAGRLWVTTSGGGIACRTQQNFQHFSRADGLAGDRIYAVHIDTAQHLWLAASRNGIQVFDSTGFSSPITPPFFRDIKYKTICSDSTGNLWVGSEGRGIAVKDTSGWFQLTTSDGLPSDWILKLITDKQGIVWGATYSNGIFRVARNDHRDYSITSFGIANGLPDRRISAFTIDPEGHIWYGTITGHVGRIFGDESHPVFDEKHGLINVPIRSLAFDDFGQLWIGTKGKGVFFGALTTDPVRFTNLSAIHPTVSENIYLLLADKEANIWAGSESGVDKIQLDTLGQVKTIIPYDRNDGFLGIETCHDAATLANDGSIWFGTMNGLTRYTPGAEVMRCFSPQLHFTNIDLFYKPLSETEWAAYALESGGIREGLQLPFRENHLSFGFRAVSQIRPEDIRYRWKLEGIDTEWSPSSTSVSVNYANLQPGTYRFFVQAAVGDCPWSEPLSSPFTIAAPYWQEPWFIPLIIGIGLLIIGWVAWLVVRRIKKRERARTEALEVQNRLLQLEQKALQLQMNPHFIFNALTGIQSLVASGEPQHARQRINEFAQLMRSILDNSRNAAVSLQQEADTLKQYLQIEQFCQRQTFSSTINLPDNCDPDEIELPPMLLQPFVENAVIHGISHLSYPGEIQIDFELSDHLLTVTIQDNGVGRLRAAQLREERKPGHQSVALKVTQERLEALRKQEKYKSFEISDILDKDDQIQGTKVKVRLPITANY